MTDRGGFAPIESRDGQFLYYARGRTSPGLWRAPVDDGEEELILMDLHPTFWGMWVLREKGIYFLDAPSDGPPPCSLKFLDLKTRVAIQLCTIEGVKLVHYQGLAISPDGEQLLYTKNPPFQRFRRVFEFPRASTVAPANPLQIVNAWTYLAKPFDASTKPLLVDAAGHALIAVHTYPDGRMNLAMTFDSNQYLLHNQLFSYGVINWVTKGLFIGERRIYMSPQIDDLFIPDSRWTAQTPCPTPPDGTGQELRITASDLNAVVAWQDLKRRSANTADFRLTMAYNGVGAENLRENLTRAARKDESEFYWVNHTYDHENLDAVDATVATWEIAENNRVGRELGLSRWNVRNLVTPEVSGLTNPAFLHAAYAAGVRYLVSDTSRLGYGNPSPNAGIYNAIEPRLFMIPRRPNNLFFNVATPSDWTSEYNCMYRGYWTRDLSYEEILDVESQFLLTYMLQGEMDPWMFHQTNMKVHTASRTLLTDLLDRTLTKYNGYFNLPIQSPPMHQVGERMKQRMAFDAAQASATLFPGSLSISASGDAVVPITGAAITGAETYGGQRIARIDVKAGQTVSVPLP